MARLVSFHAEMTPTRTGGGAGPGAQKNQSKAAEAPTDLDLGDHINIHVVIRGVPPKTRPMARVRRRLRSRLWPICLGSQPRSLASAWRRGK